MIIRSKNARKEKKDEEKFIGSKILEQTNHIIKEIKLNFAFVTKITSNFLNLK